MSDQNNSEDTFLHQPSWNEKSLPPRAEKTERALWKNHVEPIIRRHNLKRISGEVFKYRYIDKQINAKDVDEIVRKTSRICLSIQFPKAEIPASETNDLYGGEINFSKEVVQRLRDSAEGKQEFFLKTGGKIDLRETFRDFLEDIFKDNTLPEFLMMLWLDGFTHVDSLNDSADEETEEGSSDVQIKLKTTPKERKTRYHDQRAECGKLAKQWWADEPSLTTAEVIRKLRKKVKRKDSNPFTDKTYRVWVQDINPNFKGK